MRIGSGRYVLNDKKEPVLCEDLMEWAKWFETIDCRRVREDVIGWRRRARVSTVFLGLDHNFFEKGPPLVFETMIFGGPHDGYQTRCSTWAEAEAMHEKAVKLVRGIK